MTDRSIRFSCVIYADGTINHKYEFQKKKKKRKNKNVVVL